MPSFSIHTLGCRANQADSEQLAQILLGAGFQEVAFGQPADCQIVNTCTVTREADRKSAQMVRRAARLGEQVVVTGCGAAQKGGTWQRVPSTALRLPPDQRDQILEKIGARHCPSGERLERGWLRRDRARALLRIQEGCDQFCTFCIVPYVRGRARSQTREWVLQNVLELGASEVVLSGIHLSAWGRERGEDLADLVEYLLQETRDIRFRLSSVEPDLFPERMFELMGDPRLCPHLHLVLQHASDRILERMHRGYDLAHYDGLVQKLRQVPGASLTTDLMVGFPGETDQDFETMMGYVRRTPFARIHVFPYSQRPGTAAARFPAQVDEAILQARRDRLLRLAQRKQVAFQRENLGTVREALIESESERQGWMKATSDNFLPLLLRGGPAMRGLRLRCRLKRRWGEQIVAVPEEGF
ncbi:MiaB/RimO family radical SAM methylthiotransferase [bacterium]|nr:MiaB/RimO family radical SAM methylthiotransferase [bacterium]